MRFKLADKTAIHCPVLENFSPVFALAFHQIKELWMERSATPLGLLLAVHTSKETCCGTEVIVHESGPFLLSSISHNCHAEV